MKSDYDFHEKIYKKRKQAGRFGWIDEDNYRQTIEDLKIDLPDLEKGANILEIGCGNGVYLLWLEKQGYIVWGIDIAPTAIEWAKGLAEEQGSQAVFNVGSVAELEKFYAEGQFDLVIDGNCLHCIIGDDRGKLLSGVKKILKDDGMFLVQTLCNDPAFEAPGFDPESRYIFNQEGIAGRYLGKVEDLRSELADGNFEVIRDRVIENPFDNGQEMYHSLCRIRK
ncbi:class I SAM-dependent methyltransferase [bacterium]|nr:class I SAM-dependent methyltransferase [bacterium]